MSTVQKQHVTCPEYGNIKTSRGQRGITRGKKTGGNGFYKGRSSSAGMVNIE